MSNGSGLEATGKEGKEGGRCWIKFEKGEVGNIGFFFYKIGGLGPLCQLLFYQ